MKRFKSCLLASAGLVILAAALSLTAPGRVFAQRVKEDCVRICDTAASPLHVIVRGVTHVTGDVRISNEDAIATTVSGPVQVTTSPREPLAVAPQLKAPDVFQKQVSLTLQPGELQKGQIIHVPSPKLLEIKYASGTASTESSLPTNFFVKIIVSQGGNSPITFPLPLEHLSEGALLDSISPRVYQVGGGPLQIFANPGSTVVVLFMRGNNWNQEATLELAISGIHHEP